MHKIEFDSGVLRKIADKDERKGYNLPLIYGLIVFLSVV